MPKMLGLLVVVVLFGPVAHAKLAQCDAKVLQYFGDVMDDMKLFARRFTAFNERAQKSVKTGNYEGNGDLMIKLCEDASNLRSRMVELKTRYSGVNCPFHKPNPAKLDPDQLQLEVGKTMEEKIALIDKVIKTFPENVRKAAGVTIAPAE